MNSYQRGQKALCGDYFKYTPAGASQFKRAGRWHKEPFPGDVVFFYSHTMGRICHVGIVEKVEGRILTTLEGNTSSATVDRNGGECRRKTYSNYSVGGNSWIHGFGRPVYNLETCSVEKLLEIARGEIGYEEKATPRNLEDKHANKGKTNYTKYGEWYNHGKALSEPWCAEYVSWCFYKACASADVPTGWTYRLNNWYYFKDGVPVSGRFEYINGRWYAFDNAGALIKGWLKSGEGWYYLGEDGGMLAGQWLQDKGKWYYLSKTGVMATNAKIRKTKGDGFDYVGEDGVYNPVKSLLIGRDNRVEIVD